MPPDMNVVITVGARDTGRDAYPVQIQHKGKGLADDWVRIDRLALLLHEHEFSAPAYGLELYDALFTGKLGRAYQRLIGRAGAETAIRVQLVIHPDAPELHALPLERIFHRFGNEETLLTASARCSNMGQVYVALGDLARAEQWLTRTVELDEALGHPDLESDHATLERVRTQLRIQLAAGQRGKRFWPLVTISVVFRRLKPLLRTISDKLLERTNDSGHDKS